MSALITADLISLDENLGSNRFEVIRHLAESLERAGRTSDLETLYAAARAREEKTDTGIPGGIAIPHCRSEAVSQPTLAMARPNPAVDFGAKDGPADLIFFIAAPADGDEAHLKILSQMARSLMKKSFTAALRQAQTAEEVVALVEEALGLREKAPEAPASQPAAPVAQEAGARKKIVAVTNCPTGIAHTYMAADGLKYAAEELGYDFKVEPQGSSGGEKLSQAEIDEADAVVFAVALPVRGRERFAGKPFVEAPVKRGIDEPAALIEEALAEAANPSGKRVTAASAADTEASNDSGPWGTRIYKALMTGVSYMIPFVAAGGIILALGFMLEAMTMPNLGDVDPQAILANASLTNLNGTALSLYLGAALHTIGGFGLSAMVPILAAYIAYGLAQRPGIAPGFIAGSVAVLVGGGFLGGIVGGLLAGLCAYWLSLLKLPRWLASMMPVVVTPLVATLFAGGLMFFLLGGPLAWVTSSLEGWLNSMTGTSAILLGIILGAMMGFDLGGPVNKAAYLFATAGLSAGTLASQQIMAAVIIAGMVPPLAMAVATSLRPALFSGPERENGKAAWLLGASFISEGAIPFATADPLRVIPSSMVGAAVAGAISMGAGVASPAPHGGVWIIALVENPIMFLVAAIAGALVGGLMYIVLKSLAGAKAQATA
ncbi:MAG: fructose-specific PTS transporter subunit EIIC [Rothia sp. (in: high G+C Gram-positive bacteria)]|nr:fructose-specific PTS transporter subunit EIIC [Rothia sp. (in: high G+C Gram-positive bacteria)]